MAALTTRASVKAARLIASGLGAGYVPVAPGTAGSLLGLAMGAALLACSPDLLAPAALLACVVGLWAASASGSADQDPGWIVIDEVAGQLIALLALARPTALGLLAAFALFRSLDIAKPGPVGWLDRRADALGIMGDDIVAGALTAALLWLLGRVVPGVLG